MTVHLQRIDADFSLRATTEGGHVVITDGSPAIGGHDAGPRPMELLLSAVGSCSAIDVILLLRKQRQEPDDFRITVTGTRRDEAPRVFTAIHVAYEFVGAVDERKAERACRLSMEKMCSVSLMLKAGGVDVSWDYRVTAANDSAPD